MQSYPLRCASCIGLCVLAFLGTVPFAGGADADPYPLGLHLRVLERDLESKDYRDVLATMIPTDLEQEWKRVATADNYVTFLAKHGGEQSVFGHSGRKAAYERRRAVADGFLELMTAAYAKRKKRPPFKAGPQIEKLLAGAARRVVPPDRVPAVPIRAVMPAPGSERQWPQLRGPTGQGTAIEKVFPLRWGGGTNIVWKTQITGRGHSSPVVWDDRIFITTATQDGKARTLLCYSRSDGALLWTCNAPEPPAREKLIWKNTYASSTPVTDGERVIVFFGNSGFICCNMQGKLQWKQDVGTFTTMHGPGTSPVLYRDKVIFIHDQNRADSVFVALDKRTGRKLWQHERKRAMCWTTPVVIRVGDHDELVYNGSHEVIGYNPDTGLPIWRLQGPSKEAVPGVVIGAGLIFSASGRNGPVLAIRPGGRGDVTETHLAWRRERGGAHVPSPVYYDGRLYMVRLSDGTKVWSFEIGESITATPAVAAGMVVVGAEDGNVYAFAPSPKPDDAADE